MRTWRTVPSLTSSDTTSLRVLTTLPREVIAWAREMGYSYLDLGTYTLDMEVNHGLCRFKESFSARGRFRDTFYGKL